MSKPLFPWRICDNCGWMTTSTSTLDYCIKCRTDGLRPKIGRERSPNKSEGKK